MNQADGDVAAVERQAGGDLVLSLIWAAHSVQEELEQALQRHSLSIAKLNVLSRLAEAGEPLSLSELASRLNCVRSNVTQLVDRLEAEGLVRREADPSDRRSIRAVLTPAGRARQRVGVQELEGAESRVAGLLARCDREALGRALEALR